VVLGCAVNAKRVHNSTFRSFKL